MVVKPSERKIGIGSEKLIGIGKGPLICVNPDLAKKKELYGWADKADETEIAYSGEKNGKDWARLCFVFQDETTGKYAEYGIFISDELAEFEKDGITKSWYVNQWGQTQLVDNEKNLFKSFTHMQKQNEDKTAWEDVLDENGDPVKLIYRKAHKGETSLYSMLRHLVTQDWFKADAETNLFISMKSLLRGSVKDISMYIGTDVFQPLVFMVYVEAKDTDNGVQYSNNCVDQAWMPGWKIKDANIATSSNSWNKFEIAPKGKGSYKLKDMYNFYQSCKRNKHMWALAPLAVFSAENYQAAGSVAFIPAEGGTTEVNDASY